MKLIYHKDEDEYSVFDTEIIELVRNKNIRIACPYLGIKYLERIINLSKSWLLITDIEEWIKSNSKKNRVKIFNFIKVNQDKIHHCRNLHAKLLLAPDKALLGSANFTNKGIKEKIEISVVFNDPNKIEELDEWFNLLWEETNSISMENLSNFIKKLKVSDFEEYVDFENSVFCKKNTLNKKIISLNEAGKNSASANNDFENSENQLVTAIKKIGDKNKLNEYFNIVKELLEYLEVNDDDSRISLTITKIHKIPVNIGQRYVIRPEKDMIGLIMPLEYEELNYVKDKVIRDDVDYFYKNKQRDAKWIWFEAKDKIELPEKVKEYWKKAALKELRRSKRSGFRRHHKSVVFFTAMDLDYRAEILSKM